MMFRRFATEHPSLFALGIQRQLPLGTWRQVTDAAQAAFQSLMALVARLDERQLLGEPTVSEAALEFHALCEGLAAVEVRGMAPMRDAEQSWRQGLTALVEGFALSAGRTVG
jgi:hypothetical protein